MKFILITILVLAFILAPIIALKPRGRQGRVEKLRLQARALGASFSMRRLPALKTEAEISSAFAVYSLPPGEALLAQAEWILRKTSYSHDLNFFKEWDWGNEQRPSKNIQKLLLASLEKLPPSVKALSAGPQGVSVFWTEEGNHKMLEELIDLLSQIKRMSAD